MNEQASVETGPVRTAYCQTGAGPALLLIHGAEADHRMFDVLAADLRTDFTVIAYDQRDSGATCNPATSYHLLDLADDAAALLDSLGLARAHVYGTSLGGTIAQALASRHPGRVDRLILGSTWPAGQVLAQFNPQTAAELARLRTDAHSHASEIAAYFLSDDYLRRHPEQVERFRRSGRTLEQRTRRARMQTHPGSVDLRKITAPTLLLAGAADRLIPPVVTFGIATQIPHSAAALLDEAPHVAVLEMPDRVAEHIRRFILPAAAL